MLLGSAVDAGDALAAQRAIEAWPTMSRDDGDAPERLAASLVRVFSALVAQAP